MKFNTVFDCSLLEISKINNEAGNLTILENGLNIIIKILMT